MIKLEYEFSSYAEATVVFAALINRANELDSQADKIQAVLKDACHKRNQAKALRRLADAVLEAG